MIAESEARVALLVAHLAVREAIGRVLHAQPRELSAAAEALAASQTQLHAAVERVSAVLSGVDRSRMQ